MNFETKTDLEFLSFITFNYLSKYKISLLVFAFKIWLLSSNKKLFRLKKKII
jgi:hypothetical protein